MASVEITDEDILNVLTEPCRNTREWRQTRTCFSWKRCGKCEDGRVLTYEGKRLALLFRTWDGSMHGELPTD